MSNAPPRFLDNADRRLRRVWHPVAVSENVGDFAVEATLLGETWLLTRRPELVACEQLSGSRAYGVVDRYGLVWLAAEKPLRPLPDAPECDDPAFRRGVVTRRTRVGAGVLVDNFLDVTHFSYLHERSFGRSTPVTTENVRVTRAESGLQLVHETVLDERPAGPDTATQVRLATYTHSAPFAVHLRMSFPPAPGAAATLFVCQPESVSSTIAYAVVAVPRAEDVAAQMALSAAVLDEDLAILERMADPRLALTLHTELHTRADRASVELRKDIAGLLAEAGNEAAPRDEPGAHPVAAVAGR